MRSTPIKYQATVEDDNAEEGSPTEQIFSINSGAATFNSIQKPKAASSSTRVSARTIALLPTGVVLPWQVRVTMLSHVSEDTTLSRESPFLENKLITHPRMKA